MRVLFEQVGGGVEAFLEFGGFADCFDLRGANHGGGVTEGISDVGEGGGHFFISESFEGGHGDLAGVFFAFDFDGSEEAVHGELDEALGAALDPLCFG